MAMAYKIENVERGRQLNKKGRRRGVGRTQRETQEERECVIDREKVRKRKRDIQKLNNNI